METFSIAPAATRALWVVPAIVVGVLVLVGLLLGRSVVASRSARFIVTPAGLQLHGDWYGRTIPWTELRGHDARRVEFAAEPGLAPQSRTMGTGLPGYQAGWFRLQNGERALLFLTDRRRAVYVPTTAGYSVLVSPADPDAFLAALRARAR
ncbi:MAG: PH domain-containing protein [Vicinamibacterales bacterium]